MRARVQKWGNGLAVRIPKALTAEMGLQEDSTVELKLSHGRLLIERALQGQPSLRGLLRRVTKQNLQREAETGPAVGNEIW